MSRITILIITSILASCHMKDNGHILAARSGKDSLSKKESQVARFDSLEADTKSNRQRFIEFFHFEPGPDVKKIYCYAANQDSESKYQISFQCESSTLQKIIRELQLQSSSQEIAPNNFHWKLFEWWDGARIKNIKPYWKKNEEGLNQYLWYESTSGTAYFYDTDS